LKNTQRASHFRQSDGKIECPFCGIFVKNIQLHFQRKQECGDKIDRDHFMTIYEDYKKENNSNKNLIRVQNFKLKLKQANPEAFRVNQNQEQQNKRDKQKASNPEAFSVHHNQEQQKARDKQKE
jgi:hypothetical protein